MTNPAFKPSLKSQISHELRIPVSGILGFVRFLSETTLTQEQRSYLTHIEDSANRLVKAQGKIDHILTAFITKNEG